MKYVVLLLLASLPLFQGCSRMSVAGEVVYDEYGEYPDHRRHPGKDVVVIERGGRGPGHIPPGHLPPPGESRVWIPGVPPGHQPPPFRH